ncbi:hypothetical protein EZV62_012792 [Acer yangbiense]|uniref:SWIM-type domain-containing protein n=1 Tax=Acer yangbiense TaxID=1000413 RepID=A0A5C7HXK9_9ROSI|nr:hypothetical protein EZV62_012792 [Acer yangbiense]
MAVNNDSDLVDVFKLFSNHEKKSITFEVEKKAYIPLPPEASTNIPNEHPRFIIDNQNIGFSDFENNLFDYEGDNEDAHGDNEDGHSVSGDSDGVIKVDSGRAQASVDEDEFGLGDGSYDFGLGHGSDEFGLGDGLDEVEKNINLELFEGYNSHPDDEFVSDSEVENMDAKIARLVKTNPFKQLLGTPIEFEVGQTHDSVYSLRALLTDYAIQEGFNFNKVKNDRNRLTYACQEEGCPWRLHASNLIDDTTMQIKTYKNEHLCHRLCRSKEARAKWIVSKFGALVKSNPDIRPGVISDQLRDQFNVTSEKEGCGKWKSEIPPTVNKKIVENSADSRILQLIHAGEGKYELMGLNRPYTANLQEKTCECGAWQISGVPCSHALAGIRHFYGMGGINEGITQFIHPSLSKSAFLRSYSSMLSPIPDFCVWVDMEAATVDPPPIKNKLGKPKLVWKRESHEKPKASRSGNVICTKCRNPSHNKRTCKAVITSESNKRAAKDVNKSSTNARVEVGASSSQPPTQDVVDATISKSMYMNWGAHHSVISGDNLQLVLDQYSARLSKFRARACKWDGPVSASLCAAKTLANWWTSPVYSRLSDAKMGQLKWVRDNHMIYDYCKDTKRFNGQLPPECFKQQF